MPKASKKQARTSTTKTATRGTTNRKTSKRSAPRATAGKQRATTAASETLDLVGSPAEELKAPAPRDHSQADDGLKRRAEAIIRLHGITFCMVNGRRAIQSDDTIPQDELKVLGDAMRAGLV